MNNTDAQNKAIQSKATVGKKKEGDRWGLGETKIEDFAKGKIVKKYPMGKKEGYHRELKDVMKKHSFGPTFVNKPAKRFRGGNVNSEGGIPFGKAPKGER